MCCVMGYTGHDLSAAKFKEYLLRTVMRGPDDQRVVEGPFGLMGFGRLAIMGLTPEGMQPFYRGADCVVCNGELYGFRFEKEILKRRGYKFASDCDCEILLPLYYEYGLDMFRHMDSEFALILYDSRKDRLIAARDPIGIRPLFYGYSKSSHQIAFASEMQNLIGWCDDIRPFPIGSYYCDGRFVRYEDIADVPAPMEDDMETTLRNIREKLIAGVEKRLDADAPVGFLLSGGLDSSLVCSIAAKKLGKPIRTFAIGMDTDAIDLKYARQTADYLGSEHHEIIINRDMVIQSLEEVIRLLGTWDITTIRASMGMYLLCKAIHEQTDVRVLLTGEISDELFGYKYTDYAPTADAFQQESQKRIRELYMYDVLRADRCISANSIEARVPFGFLLFSRRLLFGFNALLFFRQLFDFLLSLQEFLLVFLKAQSIIGIHLVHAFAQFFLIELNGFKLAGHGLEGLLHFLQPHDHRVKVSFGCRHVFGCFRADVIIGKLALDAFQRLVQFVHPVNQLGHRLGGNGCRDQKGKNQKRAEQLFHNILEQEKSAFDYKSTLSIRLILFMRKANR